jgi:hypothetical protein
MTTTLKSYFNVGPFADNHALIYDFTTSIYVNHLYQETIQELLEAEAELSTAIEDELGDEIISMLKERIKFLDAVVSLANKNYQPNENCVA